MNTLEKLIEPQQLEAQLNNPNLLIVDLSNPQHYQQQHIPGAYHVAPSELVSGIPPATGKLPSKEQLEKLFTRLGLTSEKHIVAYDDEGGGWAGRFIWTLDMIGHSRWSYLNGGIIAWSQEGHPVNTETPPEHTVPVTIELKSSASIEAEEIIQRLDELLIWDARSPEEFNGTRITAQRTGHIPGAINCEWTCLMDSSRNFRLREDAREYLTQLGITADRPIVTHCQTHHRSGFTYLAGRLLDFADIRAYPGSWSEWGNRNDTPITTE